MMIVVNCIALFDTRAMEQEMAPILFNLQKYSEKTGTHSVKIRNLKKFFIANTGNRTRIQFKIGLVLSALESGHTDYTDCTDFCLRL